MDSTKTKTPSACSGSPKIDYPCLWLYKVIGSDPDLMREAIASACTPYPVRISPSNSSAKGNYWSVNAEVEVRDEPMRLSIYQSLAGHPAIKLVL